MPKDKQTTSKNKIKNSFTETEWSFLAFLPFRIGVWISDYEQGGGERAELAELKALSDIILVAQAKYENYSLLSSLAQETERLIHQQTKNDHKLDKTLNDCKRATTLLKKYCTDKEVNCYKLLCIDVAEAVAKAAGDREFGAHNLQNGAEKGWFGVYPMIASLTRLGHGPKVSNAEKDAINELIDALGANQIVNKWDKID